MKQNETGFRFKTARFFIRLLMIFNVFVSISVKAAIFSLGGVV